jgi:hypothetical protein
LGELLPRPADKWWTLTGGPQGEAVKVEVMTLLAIKGLPLLDRMSHDEELRDLWLSNHGPGLTAFQRLMYASVLVGALGPAPSLAPILDELRQQSAGKPVAGAVAAHIRRLAQSNV